MKIVPRPLLLLGVWFAMLVVAMMFLYVIENAIIVNLPWFGSSH